MAHCFVSIGNSRSPPSPPPPRRLLAFQRLIENSRFSSVFKNDGNHSSSTSFHALLASLFLWLFNTKYRKVDKCTFSFCWTVHTHSIHISSAQCSMYTSKSEHFPIESFLLIRLYVWLLKLSSSIYRDSFMLVLSFLFPKKKKLHDKIFDEVE